MPLTLEQPDITLGLKPNPYAPRVARQAVAEAGDTSPDLRDAVALMVSNLVTRVCRMRPAESERIGLRAWMLEEVVRVEVQATRNPLEPLAGDERWPDYDIELLEGLADRWGIDSPGSGARVVWFEIDRHAVAVS